MRVLGVDPGSDVTGYAVVESIQGRLRALGHGVVRAGTAPEFHLRLVRIHQTLTEVIQQFHPTVASVENIFYAQNVQSALKLGQARGGILLTLGLAGVSVHSYTPLEIKQTVVGYGRAGKEQVREMVRFLLGLSDTEMPLDASDALAAAICHIQSDTVLHRMGVTARRRR